jgi:hypothetical protein
MANTYVQIGSTVTVGSGGSSTISFSSIPATYTDLKVVLSVRNTTATTVGNVTLDMQINGLTTGYTGKQLFGSSTTVGSLNRNNVIIGTLNSANDTASTFSNIEVYIPNYASSNAKAYSVDSVSESNTSVTELDLLAKLNSTTSAITSLTFLCSFDNFAQHSTASLYGIKNS